MTSHLFLVLACVTCASVSAYTLPSPQQPSLSDSSQDQLETFLYQLQTALEDEEEERAEMQWRRPPRCTPRVQFGFRSLQFHIRCCQGPNGFCLDGLPTQHCSAEEDECSRSYRGRVRFLKGVQICEIDNGNACYTGTALRSCNTAESMASSQRSYGYYY